MGKAILDFGLNAFFNKKKICYFLKIDRNKNQFSDIDMTKCITMINNCTDFECLNYNGIKTYNSCKILLNIKSNGATDTFCHKIKANFVRDFLVKFIILNYFLKKMQ